MPKITVNGQEYDDFNNLPPEVKEKIKTKLGKLKNIPFAKDMLKMYGMDVDNPGLPDGGSNSPFGDMPSGNSNPFGNSQFGGSQFSSSPGPQFNSPFFTKKSSMGWAVGVIIIVCFLGVAGLIFGINAITSSWEETFELKGDPTHFDPIAAVNEVRSHIDPNAKLSEISISYIRSDGTMDLKATYRPNVEYDFYRELAEPPKDAPPVGAGGTVTGKWYEPVEADVYEPGQWRYVSKMGGGVSTEYSYANKGIDLDRGSPTASPPEFTDDPKCSIKDFWTTAIKKGAPSDAVARVDYDKSGYDFSISDANINLEFDQKCKLKGDGFAPEVSEPVVPAEAVSPPSP